MKEPEACEREIRSLHAFFVDWYTGSIEEDGFERFDDALAPSFEMVTPDGEVLTRDEIRGYVHEKKDEHADGAFSIEIRNVEAVEVSERRALMRYEEWQTTGEEWETNGRLSTALFGTSEEAPEGVDWLHLHETWLNE